MNCLKLIEQCYNSLPKSMKDKPWVATGHGRKVLQTEDELNAYIAAYGEMHLVKCRAALQNFPFDDLDLCSYEIFDWGCGQGIATLTLLDMLQERGKLSHLKRIYLIEPSYQALFRATNWVKQNVGPGIDVISINSYIPNNSNASMSDVSCSSRISINLFSNILDIRSLSLSWLAKKTASLANTNYMICIGPKFKQNTNTRITDFCGYFHPSKFFSNIDSDPYSYTTGTHYAYGCETKCFVHQNSESLDYSYNECSIEDASIDPYDYAAEVLSGVVDDKIIKFYNKLRQLCGNAYDVFFRPAINCDTADFVLASQIHGIILINVCTELSEIKEAFSRIESVKNNLYNIHLRTIKIDSIMYPSVYNCVKTALFFPNNSIAEINEKIKELNEIKNKELNTKYGGKHEKDHYAYLFRFTETSSLKEELERINPLGFKIEYYNELINLISSKWHSYKDGDFNLHLSQKQRELVRSDNKRLRVKGVSGCGKTQVVANRAVEQHLKTGERVLIITFNISLIQYIRMRISQVPADFSPNMFEVINYHQFFISKANLYASQNIALRDFDNPDYFKPYRNKIIQYKSIIIDEVQDFKESWLQLIITNFLSEDGSVSLFGDGEQNIYDRELEEDTKMPPISSCGFTGRWNEMSERISRRIINPKIALLSSSFAKSFLKNGLSIGIQNEFVFDNYYVRYWNVDHRTSADRLAGNINGIINEYHLEYKNVVVLGQSINLLRDIEAAFVRNTNMNTMLSFETAAQYSEVKKRNSSPSIIQKDLEEIRRAAKTHFTTDCSCIKFSTIHSFKGWESKSVILLLQPEMHSDESYDGYRIQDRENTPALIYTALTRAKCDLFILNLNNPYYHTFFINNILQ